MKKSIILGFLLITNIYSQEFGGSVLKLWSDNSELNNAYGFSLFASAKVKYLDIKFEFNSANNNREYFGAFSAWTAPTNKEVIFERIESEVKYYSFDFSIFYPISLNIFDLNVSPGLGIVINNFRLEKNGLKTDIKRFDKDNKFGWFYRLSIAKENIFQLPLKFEILYWIHVLISIQ